MGDGLTDGVITGTIFYFDTVSSESRGGSSTGVLDDTDLTEGHIGVEVSIVVTEGSEDNNTGTTQLGNQVTTPTTSRTDDYSGIQSTITQGVQTVDTASRSARVS